MESEAEFDALAQEFFNLSEKFNDQWKRNKKDSKVFYTKNTKIVEATKNTISDPEDPSACNSLIREIYSVEYHLTYSISYSVPVLYFNIYQSTGSLVDLEQVWDIFLDNIDSNLSRESMLSTVTQAEHPILFKPFFTLHPCKFHEVLEKFPNSKNLVVTFLSIFGPAVGLQMSVNYDKFYQTK